MFLILNVFLHISVTYLLVSIQTKIASSVFFFFFFAQIIMAIVSSWVICAIITAVGGFPSDPDSPQYSARTDRELSVLKEALWLRFPYPG